MNDWRDTLGATFRWAVIGALLTILTALTLFLALALWLT